MSDPTGIARRLSLGVGSQAYGQLVLIVIRLGEVPLFLHYWGARLYGEWLMLAAVPAYLALSDGGFSGAASRDMTMRAGADDQSGALAVFQSTWAFLCIVSLVVVAVVMLSARLFPLASWFSFRAIGASQLNTVLFLLLIYVFIGFQSDLLYGGFWCSGRYSLGIAVTNTTRLIEFVALVTTVIMGGGPVQAAEAYLVGRIAGTVMTRLALRRATPWLHYGLGRISVQEIRRLARPAFASISFPLGNALNIQAIRIVVGLVLGPLAVAVFAPLRTLSNLTTRPGAVINGVIEPELAVAFGRGDRTVFSQLFLRGCQAAVWLSISAALSLTLVARWLWPVWTGGRIPMEWPLFLTLLGAGILNSLWYTALMVPYATNRHGRIAIVYTGVYGAMALVGAYVAALNFGLVGVGAALLAAELLVTMYVLPTSLAMDQQHWGTWLATVIRPPTFIVSETLAVARRFSMARSER